MTTYSKYTERFNKKTETSYNKQRDSSVDSKLMSNKEIYTQFLEVQLEKVASALLTVDTFSDKIEQALSKVNDFEDKFSNTNKLLKLLQSFTDAQVNQILIKYLYIKGTRKY